MYITHLVYPFISQWTLGLFHLLAIESDAAMTLVCKYLSHVYTQVELLGLL